MNCESISPSGKGVRRASHTVTEASSSNDEAGKTAGARRDVAPSRDADSGRNA